MRARTAGSPPCRRRGRVARRRCRRERTPRGGSSSRSRSRRSSPPRVDLVAHGADEPLRERRDLGRVGPVPVEEPAAVHRDEERGRGERGAGLERRSPPDEPDDERRHGAHDREPRDPRRRRIAEDVVEVAGVDDLQEHPEAERERKQQRPDQAREHGHPAGEREREGKEPGRPTRLRDRDEVRERGEQEREEHHREHRQRAADHVRRPAPARGEPRERDEQQRRDRHCTLRV